jgi:fibronectin type 3 domain-containing protein
VTIGQGVTSIGNAAFAASNLNGITVPDSVTTIGDSAFDQCWGLQSASLGGGLVHLGDYAFASTGLLSITIPDSVTYIGQYCFNQCPEMTYATIGASVGYIGWCSFTNIPSLANINFRGLSTPTVNTDEYSPWIQFSGYPNGPTGHAYAASAFPAPGNTFYGLNMGAYLTSAPFQPTNLTAANGNAQVVLAWTPPLYNGGSAVTGYKVYWAVPGGSYAVHATLNGLTYTATGLTNGQTYLFRITATNSYGEGPQSLAATVKVGLPHAPQMLTATNSSGQVQLTWASPDPLGIIITGYNVYRSTSQTGAYQKLATTSTTGYTDTGLSNGQQFWYYVTALNTYGEGAPSPKAPGLPRTVPDAPRNVVADPGNTMVNLSWNSPVFDGGSPGDYYVIFMNGVAQPGLWTSNTAVITGLVNGQAYSFTVAMHNVAGLGNQSTSASAVPFTIPGTCQMPALTAGNAQITASWAIPNNGGAAIDYYVIFLNGAQLPQQYASPNAIIGDLTPGSSYNVAVAAHNLAGLGPLGPVASATPFTLPGVPSLSAEMGEPYTVLLSWTAPVDGYSEIDYYLIYMNGNQVLGQFPGTNASISGLMPGLANNFTVAAHNAAGLGGQSNSVMIAASTTPSAPTQLAANPNGTGVDLSWTAGFNGGAQIIRYDIFRGTAPGGEGTIPLGSVAGTMTAFTDSTAALSQAYYYTVAATNVQGTGPSSNEASIALTPPSVPDGMAANNALNRIHLSWGAPDSTGSTALIRYDIYRGTTPGGEASAVYMSVDGSQLEANDNNVNIGQTYYYFVKAVNAQGSSDPSSEAHAKHILMSDPEPNTVQDNSTSIMYATAILALFALAALVLIGRKKGW